MTYIRTKAVPLVFALFLATTFTLRPAQSQAIGLYHGGAMVVAPILSYACGSMEIFSLCIASAVVVAIGMGFGMGGMFAPDEPVTEADEKDWQQVRAHFEPAFGTVSEDAVKKAFHQRRRGASIEQIEQTLRLGELLH